MDESTLKIIGWVILTLFFVATVVFRFFLAFSRKSAKDYEMPPMLKLDFIETPKQIKEILKTDAARLAMIKALRLDTYAIVPLYTIFFLLLSFVLSQRTTVFFGKAWVSLLLGALAAFWALTAAFFGTRENILTFKILSYPVEEAEYRVSQETINQIRAATNIKFAAAFFCVALLSLVFWRQSFDTPGKIASLALFGAMILSSILGLAGMWFYRLINPAMLILILVSLGAGVFFAFGSRQFLIGF